MTVQFAPAPAFLRLLLFAGDLTCAMFAPALVGLRSKHLFELKRPKSRSPLLQNKTAPKGRFELLLALLFYQRGSPLPLTGTVCPGGALI